MFSSKKALENYFYAIVVVGVIMSFLLVYLLTFAYGSDHPKCQDLDFTMDIVCKERGVPRVEIRNSGSEELFFILNGEKNVDNYRVDVDSTRTLRVPLRDTDEIELLPLVRTEEIFYECRGHVERRDPEVVSVC